MQNSSTEIDGLKILLGQHSCLILDSSLLFTTNLRGALRLLGLPAGQIFTATNLAQASGLLNEKRPSLLICNYSLENTEAYSLVESFEKSQPEKNRVTLLTIFKGETPLICRGQVDGHIEKPFNIDAIRKTLLKALVNKFYPDEYTQHVRAADDFEEAGNLALAIDKYAEAKKLSPKPFRACRGLAKVFRRQARLAEALVELRVARSHEPLDFKTVTWEFEVLMELGDFESAVDLVPLIRDSFPLSPERLVQLFDVVRLSNRMDALVPLLRVFRTMTRRTKPLLKAIEVSFFHAGSSMIPGDLKKSHEYFEVGFNCTGRKFEFIDSVVREYLRHNLSAAAESFLSKTEASDVGSGSYQRLCFEMDCRTMAQEQILNRGRKLITDGHGTPEIFLMMVAMFAKAGKKTLAESIISTATEKFPFLRSQLYEVLSLNSPSTITDLKEAA